MRAAFVGILLVLVAGTAGAYDCPSVNLCLPLAWVAENCAGGDGPAECPGLPPELLSPDLHATEGTLWYAVVYYGVVPAWNAPDGELRPVFLDPKRAYVPAAAYRVLNDNQGAAGTGTEFMALIAPAVLSRIAAECSTEVLVRIKITAEGRAPYLSTRSASKPVCGWLVRKLISGGWLEGFDLARWYVDLPASRLAGLMPDEDVDVWLAGLTEADL